MCGVFIPNEFFRDFKFASMKAFQCVAITDLVALNQNRTRMVLTGAKEIVNDPIDIFIESIEFTEEFLKTGMT